VIVDTYDPGSVTPDESVTVLTGMGSYSPALEFDVEGKLVLLMSDRTTRKAAADPKIPASWGNWTIP